MLTLIQAKELRAYLKGKGAQIADQGPEDFVTDLKQLVENCKVIWQSNDTNESGIEREVFHIAIYALILIPTL